MLGATAPALAQEDWDYHYDLSLSAVGIGKEGFVLPSYAVRDQKAYTKDSLFSTCLTGGGALVPGEEGQVGDRARGALGRLHLHDEERHQGRRRPAPGRASSMSWRFGSSFDLLLGTRYSKLSSDVVYPGTPTPFKRPGDAEWADAFIGGRFVAPVGDRVRFVLPAMSEGSVSPPTWSTTRRPGSPSSSPTPPRWWSATATGTGTGEPQGQAEGDVRHDAGGSRPRPRLPLLIGRHTTSRRGDSRDPRHGPSPCPFPLSL